MKTLKGQVTCTVENSIIKPDAVIVVEIRDVSLACAPSKLHASAKITGKTSFPFEYSIDFDEEPILKAPPQFYAISIGIRSDKLDYVTDTMFNVSEENGQILDRKDLFIIPVVPYE